MQQTLVELSGLFSKRVDPLGLLRREEELIATINRLKSDTELQNQELKKCNSRLEKRNSRLEKRNSQLEERNSQLIAHYSSRRYRLADAIFQVPGVKKLVRRRGDRPNR
jgi:DNA repair exonuclease SbcCD ATPase subunit